MENLLRPIYQERASHPDTLAVIIVERRHKVSSETDNFDAKTFSHRKRSGRAVIYQAL